jgi:hypothetical protein
VVIRKIAVVAALTVAAGSVSGPAYADKPTGGSRHRPVPNAPWVSTGQTVVTECPGADTCTADGPHSGQLDATGAVTGTVASQATLVRTVPYAGTDEASDLSNVALNFQLTQPATSVSADISFTGIKLGDGFSADTVDGHVFATAAIGADIVDSACSDRSCGSTASRVDSYVAYADKLGPVGVPADPVFPVNDAPEQSIHVTLARPDGGLVPAGLITIFAFTEAGTWASPLGCGTPTQPLCDNGIPHTGSAHAAISANISGIHYTVATAA